MKNISLGLRLAAFIVLLLGHGLTARAALVNLAASATGDGLLPTATLNQGSAAGIYDGSMYDWFDGASSPRVFAATNLQPYLTWTTPQDVRLVRLWKDVIASWDRVAVDTLAPGASDGTVEGNWVSRYDSGTAQSITFRDVDLGATFATRGLRVRAFTTGPDIAVGEVAAFSSQYNTGTLTAARITPASTGASSWRFRDPSQSANGNWFDSWLSDSKTNNPGTAWTLDQTFGQARSITGVSVTFAPQGGWAVVPDAWAVQADFGAGFQTIISGTPNGSRLQYYYDVGLLGGVSALRLLVNESASADLNNGPSVVEFEAFIPEPATLGLLAAAALLVRRRRC